MATLQAFTPEQKEKVKRMLSAKVAHMNGRKMEEADWSDIYCKAHGIKVGSWSNLNADIVIPGLSLEHKMLRRTKAGGLKTACGKNLMHPALTRQVTLPNIPDEYAAMREVIKQYQRVLDIRLAKLKAISGNSPCELRSGWFLYQSDLSEFMYFEEPMVNLKPENYIAEWSDEDAEDEEAIGKKATKAKVVESGRRKNRNLWITDKKTNLKKWSVTGADSGTKIQPYFVVPDEKDPNLYYFKVQGEAHTDGRKIVRIKQATAEKLAAVLGDIDSTTLEKAIVAASQPKAVNPIDEAEQPIREIAIPPRAYELLHHKFKGSSDDSRIQLLCEALLLARVEKK